MRICLKIANYVLCFTSTTITSTLCVVVVHLPIRFCRHSGCVCAASLWFSRSPSKKRGTKGQAGAVLLTSGLKTLFKIFQYSRKRLAELILDDTALDMASAEYDDVKEEDEKEEEDEEDDQSLLMQNDDAVGASSSLKACKAPPSNPFAMIATCYRTRRISHSTSKKYA